jgi:hypothetical protein
MQSDEVVSAGSVAKTTSETAFPLDLNGLTISLHGNEDRSSQQAAALRAAFPHVRIIAPDVAGNPLLRRRTRTEIAIYGFASLALMVVGHLLFSYVTLERLTLLAGQIDLTPDIFYFIMAGFVAQMIDGSPGHGLWRNGHYVSDECGYKPAVCHGQRSQFRNIYVGRFGLHAP